MIPLDENVPAAAAPCGFGAWEGAGKRRDGQGVVGVGHVCALRPSENARSAARAFGGKGEGGDAHQHHIAFAEVIAPLFPSDGELSGHRGCLRRAVGCGGGQGGFG